jgi:hypothetical protein
VIVRTPVASRFRIGFLVLSVALAAGCGGSSPPAPETPTGTAITGGERVRSVEVTLADSGLEPAEVDVLERYSIAENLQGRITSVLGERGALADNGALDVRVAINDFRLRSGSSAFWLGSMAGSDVLGVQVDVLKGGRVVRKFDTNAYTALGGVIYASPTTRANRLSKTVSIRVADGL